MAGDTTITVIGNATADPETRQAGQVNVTSFTVASTPRSFNKNTNEWEDAEALFLRVNCWRELGDHVAQTISKGMRVIVVGRLTQRSYEKDGQKRSSYEIEADEVGPSLKYSIAQVQRQQSSGNQQQRQQQAQQQGGPANVRHQPPPAQQSWPTQPTAPAYDENIPF